MPGADRFFVDTNLLLYSVDRTDAAKYKAARSWMTALWTHGAGSLSWQVLHEFYANAVRKLGLETGKARATVESLAFWRPAEPDLHIIRRSWHWMDAAQLSYWDGMIVAAAEQAGCPWLLSEDFQPGRKFGSVTVVHPFRAQPDDYGLGVI
jgi:predicted nucleic acid-binding protein